MDLSNQNHNSAGAHEPIAIVGMACLFPRAGSIKNYWRLIRGLEDAVTDVPESHWAIDSFYDDNPKAPDMTYCKRGAFLSDVDFDPTEYGIPPSILEATDTAQLLGLVTAKAALRDAGYLDREGHDHARTSVIMGVTGTLELVIPLGARLGHPHWRKALKDAGVEDSVADDVVRRISDNYVGWQENSFPGLLGNVVAGRIANRLDLKGTNCVVDAACASSLSAVHLAAMELATGKSDMVVTGGIDSLNDIFMFMCFSKTQALSPTGNARPFDSNADGTVIGEGCGVLVLKRQSDAERDGDTIHALLKSVGSASDGRSQSIYAPRPAGQAKALRDAYERAGVKPRQIGLVEAHGTGTKVGDAVEFEALKTVYTETNGESGGDAGGEVGPWCAVGSVKSQIGHTKAAAGAASLIKTVIALRNRVLPGTIKVKSPSPQMTESDSPFYINTETRPWLTNDASPRRAAVSSFGFGGSNFHAVLEEYPVANRAVAWDGSVEILALSAPDQKSLQDQITSRCKAFSDGVSAAEFAKQVYASRGAFDSKHSHRLLIVCEDASKAVELLRRVQERIQKSRNASEFSMPGAYYASGSASGKLAFVFPGQGSQYVGMAQGAACVFPEALDALELQPNGIAQPVGAYICPPPSFDIAQREAAAKQLRQTEVAQPALAVTELAYLRILKRFDVSPSAVAGHSFGELVALRAAGRMDDATLCRLAKVRGELMQEGAGDRGTMLVVHAAANAVADLLAKEKIDAVMGNRNAPRQVVLSGPTAGIEDAANACRQRGWEVSRLDVSGAFHSRLMGDAAKKFRKVLDGIEFHPATIDVYANRSAGLYPESKDTALDVLAGQLDSTVRFDEQIEAMYASGVRTFLEVGPKRVLSGLIGAILGDRSHKTIAVDESNSRKDGVFDLACSLAQLAAMGHQVDLSQWEDTPPVVREPKMSIPICGANYRAPRKALPPTRKVATQTPTNARPAVSQNAAVSQNGPASFERNAMQQPTHQQSTGQQSLPAQPRTASPTPVPATAPNVAAPLHLQEMYRVVGEGIRAMQSLQEQTANAHERFLETQSEAQRSFQKVIQSQQQMFGQIGGMGTVVAATPVQHAAPVVSSPVQTARPSHVPVVAPAVVAPVKETPPPVAPVVVDAVVEERAKQPSNVAAILLDVVSELTGYPTEMIEVDMDLEADLGIDSIKRVEILASVQERLPNLQTIDSSQLGSLRTLKDILSEIEGPNPDGSSPVPEQVSASDSGSASDIQGVLLDVVAELTGYPVEMLDVTMDLEADLGIDSIKRVEILAAVQARQPGLEEIDSSELGSLRTLDDILRQLGSEFSTNNSGEQGAAPSGQIADGATDSGEVTNVLLEVVSELTGYPVEMLDLTMDLEADLGIDSIKRVEILAAVQERQPELKSVDSSQLGALRTLRDIIDQLAARDGVSCNAADVSPKPCCSANDQTCADESSTSTSPPKVARQVLCAVELEPANEKPICIAAGYELWVVDDGTPLAPAIAGELTTQGIAARVVGSSKPIDGEACAPVGGIIHLLAPAPYSKDGLITSATEQVKDAFRLTKELAADIREAAKEGGALLATVSRMDGCFGLRDSKHDPMQGGLAGLAKTCALEWPEVHCRALDVDRGMDQTKALAKRILLELNALGPVEVGVTEKSRFGLVLEERDTQPSSMSLKKGDVVVVSGGARGVTAACVISLAAESKAHFVLLGRSKEPSQEPKWAIGLGDEAQLKRAILQNEFADSKKPSPSELEAAYRRLSANREINATLDGIRSAGATVEYRSANVCDAHQLAAMFKKLRAKRGPIAGIIHGAGVIEDAFIEDKDPATFDRVFDTKIAGLGALLSAAGDDPKVIVLFSSASARFGRQGQVDYAMANEVLNKVASIESRRRKNCKVVAMNWGPWAGGMVTPTLRRQFEREGVPLIPLDAGAQCFVDEICCSDGSATEVLIGGGFAQPSTPNELEQATPATETASIVAFNRRVRVDDHPFLSSHQLAGKPVLPLAMIVEWLGHGALHANPGLLMAGFDDLRVYKGVVLDSASIDLQVTVSEPTRVQSMLSVTAELRSRQKGTEPLLHARATMILADKRESSPTATLPSDIAAGPFALSTKQVYADVLFHGPDFFAIDAINGIGPKGLVAQLKTSPQPSQWITSPMRGKWLADPLAIDGVLQLGIVWQHNKTEALSLPGFVAGYRQYQDRFPGEFVKCVLHARETTSNRLVADAYLLDEKDRLIAKLEGCTWTTNPQLAAAFGKESMRSARA